MRRLNGILILNENYVQEKGCCDTMDQQLNYTCDQHGLDCPDIAIRKNSDGNYSLHAANAVYSIQYCPWCGCKLAI